MHFLIDTEQSAADLRPVADSDLDDRAWGASALVEDIRAIKLSDTDFAKKWSSKL